MPRPNRSEYMARTQQLIAYIREEIRSGSRKEGDYLPSEVELGRIFSLSKESVRKALDVLVEEGLIVKIRRVGNKVRLSAPSSGSLETSSDGRKEDLVLRLACYPPLIKEGRLQHAVSEYERQHPGTTIELLPAPFPLDYAGLGMADVVTVTGWDALKQKEKDASLSLLSEAPETEYAHPLLAKPFLDEDGCLRASPFVFSPVVVCYNRKHFEQCRLEAPHAGWTWYTLLKTARTLHRQLEVRGFAAHIQSVNRWPVFLLQNSFRFQHGEGQRAAEDPAFWDSLRISRDLIHQQGGPVLWTESDEDVERWFKEGKAAMILTTYFGLNRFLDTELDYGVAPLPALRSDDTLLLTTGLAVNRLTPHQEEAQKLVRYLCSAEVQADVRRHTLTLPAHREALSLKNGLAGNRPQVESVYRELWDRCRLYSDLNLSTVVLEAVREELKAYWSRLEDEAEASERLEALLS